MQVNSSLLFYPDQADDIKQQITLIEVFCTFQLFDLALDL